MTLTYLSLGSNLGDRAENIRKAVDALKDIDGVEFRGVSGLYETEPQGPVADQPWFLNTAAAVESSLGPWELLWELQKIEDGMGRERGAPGGQRIIDIDIVFYGDLVLYTKDLMIPHPEAARRRFVLRPIADIDPGFVHPALGRTVADLLAELEEEAGQDIREAGQ
ncbi:MAG: 2-amino-4-hydroxy-6-hydroxymethyldihydropteridine diphosphokinase [Candidatus Nitrospinota bacterium M3_3B_026]